MNKIKDVHNNESIQVPSTWSERKEHSTDFLSCVFSHNSVNSSFFPPTKTNTAGSSSEPCGRASPACRLEKRLPLFPLLTLFVLYLRNKLSFWSFPSPRFFFFLDFSLFYSPSLVPPHLIHSGLSRKRNIMATAIFNFYIF